MKKKFTLLMFVASISGFTFAQGEMDALNYSYNDLKGTARSVGMGGAFGALGDDISGISINPAGIGVYKSSEVVGTIGFNNNRTETNFTGLKTKDSKFNVSFDNIAFVTNIPIKSDVAPLINIGISYNNLKNFNRKVGLTGNNVNSSQTGYIANRLNQAGNINSSDLIISNTNDPFNGGSDQWLGGLAYNAGLIQNQQGSSTLYQSTLTGVAVYGIDNNLFMEEKGTIDSYDFNIGTTFLDMISVGATLSATDINYRMYSKYTEDWFSGQNGIGGYDMYNELRTDGTGWQVKAGVIFKPVNELRIGVAYHSPTWYQMTDYYGAEVRSDVNGPKNPVYTYDNYYGLDYHDYNFRTPDKWTFSAAGVIAKRFILSTDYELTNYKNMHLKDVNGFAYTDQNRDIKQDYKNASMVRVGAEVRITPQLSARAGYVWQETPFEKSFKDSNAIANTQNTEIAATEGTVTQYAIVGDANYFTYGLGYRFANNIYTDVAFVMKSRKDDLYTYGGSQKAELKNNLFSGLLTVGYRF